MVANVWRALAFGRLPRLPDPAERHGLAVDARHGERRLAIGIGHDHTGATRSGAYGFAQAAASAVIQAPDRPPDQPRATPVIINVLVC